MKLVYVRNRNKPNEYIVLLSTDCSLSDSEIVRRYGNRWPIECCFKACKSLLKLGRDMPYSFVKSSDANNIGQGRVFPCPTRGPHALASLGQTLLRQQKISICGPAHTK